MSEEPTQEVATVEGPSPVIAGTFAIYNDGTGGFVLVTDTTEHGTQRKHIPAAIVKLMTGKGVGGRLSALFGKDATNG